MAVKISTGESMLSNHLRPELIGPLVNKVGGPLVECNTAYGGSRSTTAAHRAAIAERGYETISHVDIMDEEGEINIPVSWTSWRLPTSSASPRLPTLAATSSGIWEKRRQITGGKKKEQG